MCKQLAGLMMSQWDQHRHICENYNPHKVNCIDPHTYSPARCPLQASSGNDLVTMFVNARACVPVCVLLTPRHGVVVLGFGFQDATSNNDEGDCSGTRFYHWGALTGMIGLMEDGLF